MQSLNDLQGYFFEYYAIYIKLRDNLTCIGTFIQEAEDYAFHEVVGTDQEQYKCLMQEKLLRYPAEIRDTVIDIIEARNRLIANGDVKETYRLLLYKML